MRQLPCVVCKGGKLLCGLRFCPILQKIKHWKKVVEATTRFIGTTPPACFVGRAFYPRVWVGVLSPPTHQEHAELFDFPEAWYEQGVAIDQILSWRGQMIYSRYRQDVKRPEGKLVELTQELAMARKPADIEVKLRKRPRFRFSFHPHITPIGNPAPLTELRPAGNVSIERKVDSIASDYDLRARQAVIELYRHGLPVSRIQKIFSIGVLGLRMERKLVPTRWSITATDSIISNMLIDRIRTYQELGELRLFSETYLGNRFEILLMPGVWSFEMIEAKFPGCVWNLLGKGVAVYSDFESYWGRKEYADRVGGAYYAARLACCEYLHRIKRQASVLVLREVYRDYYAPLGVFVIREGCRGAFKRGYVAFSSLEEALSVLTQRLRLGRTWQRASKLLRVQTTQRPLKDFIAL